MSVKRTYGKKKYNQFIKEHFISMIICKKVMCMFKLMFELKCFSNNFYDSLMQISCLKKLLTASN